MTGEMKNSVGHTLYEKGKSLYEAFVGPKSSTDLEKGMICPDDFLRAGDALVKKCPSWTWAPAPADHRVSYLPKDQQYLIIKRVPCLTRARAPGIIKETSAEIDGEDWTLPETIAPSKPAVVDVPDADPTTPPNGTAATGATTAAAIQDIDDIDDIDAIPPAKAAAAVAATGAAVAADADAAPAAPTASTARRVPADAKAPNPNPKPTPTRTPPAPLQPVPQTDDEIAAAALAEAYKPRTYDVSITYDQTYATPRIWLFGYDEWGNPLTETETCQDIWGDYTGETVTLLNHPFLGTPHVSVHPCRHAESMARMLREINDNIRDRIAAAKTAAESGAPAEEGARPLDVAAVEARDGVTKGSGGVPVVGVEGYMFVFLKFMTCVVPTISYDNTRDLDF